MKQFWTLFSHWWKRVSDCNFRFGDLNIIFGMMNETNDEQICFELLLQAREYRL